MNPSKPLTLPAVSMTATAAIHNTCAFIVRPFLGRVPNNWANNFIKKLFCQPENQNKNLAKIIKILYTAF
jgi:hypothetical protein